MKNTATLLFLTISVAAYSASPVVAQESRLAAPIERCIRDNAAKVEMAVDDLAPAVTFLVSNICAEPVAAENARESKLAQQRSAKALQDMCDQQKKNESKSAAAFMCDSAATHVGFVGVDQFGDNDVSVYTGTAPPSAIALASRLLLDLRLSHTKPGQSR